MVNVNNQGIKLYVLDNGRMRMDKNLMIAGSNQATLDNPNAPNEMFEFPIYTVFIDHPEAKILFDTACNRNSMGKTVDGLTKLKKHSRILLMNLATYLIDLNKLMSIQAKLIMS